jgi:hypothetical protein
MDTVCVIKTISHGASEVAMAYEQTKLTNKKVDTFTI